MSAASFAPRCFARSSFIDVGDGDGVAHALHRRSESAVRAADEPARAGGETPGITRELYPRCVGLVDR
jgi:hypothetical protein